MSNTDLYYKKLKNQSVFLYDFCNSAIEKLTEEKRKKLEQYHNFQAIFINKNFYLQEPILEKINTHFEINCAGIIILEKNTGYSFHVDDTRNVTINMLISSGKYHSLFKIEDYTKEKYKFEELIFEEKTFYLYNTAIQHGVINFDKPRYMFSLKFDNENLTYQEVFKWCKQNNLLEDQNINK